MKEIQKENMYMYLTLTYGGIFLSSLVRSLCRLVRSLCDLSDLYVDLPLIHLLENKS